MEKNHSLTPGDEKRASPKLGGARGEGTVEDDWDARMILSGGNLQRTWGVNDRENGRTGGDGAITASKENVSVREKKGKVGATLQL